MNLLRIMMLALASLAVAACGGDNDPAMGSLTATADGNATPDMTASSGGDDGGESEGDGMPDDTQDGEGAGEGAGQNMTVAFNQFVIDQFAIGPGIDPTVINGVEFEFDNDPAAFDAILAPETQE